MKKLSEYENEDALDLLADLIEPTAEILSDKELAEKVRGGGSKIEAVKIALKNHSKEIIAILARLDGVEPKDYKGNVATMLKSLLDILNDKELADFFTSQGQTEE